jgi:hypothetical protein
LQRAIRAARSAGIEIERIEVEAVTGKIIIVAKGAEAAESSNPLDDWLAKNARSPQRN